MKTTLAPRFSSYTNQNRRHRHRYLRSGMRAHLRHPGSRSFRVPIRHSDGETKAKLPNESNSNCTSEICRLQICEHSKLISVRKRRRCRAVCRRQIILVANVCARACNRIRYQTTSPRLRRNHIQAVMMMTMMMMAIDQLGSESKVTNN